MMEALREFVTSDLGLGGASFGIGFKAFREGLFAHGKVFAS
jgi:hypothetical protein